MRRFWWLFGLLFLCSLVIYTVGTCWMSAMAVNSAVKHGSRQLEPQKVVMDLRAAQQALQQHRQRVLALGLFFPAPDFSNTYAAYQQLDQFRQQFRALLASQGPAATPTNQYMAATERLNSYQVPSLSVMHPRMQTALEMITVVLGVLAGLLMAVRFLATA